MLHAPADVVVRLIVLAGAIVAFLPLLVILIATTVVSPNLEYSEQRARFWRGVAYLTMGGMAWAILVAIALFAYLKP